MLEIIEESAVSTPVIPEDDNVGKVIVEVELVNAEDDSAQFRSQMKSSEIRRVKLPMLVDTGATGLSLHQEAIKKLGLRVIKEVTSQFANGQTAKRKVYSSVLINVMGRSAITWVVECPSNVPALLGQIPLEMMDLMVDPRNQRLVPGHPESPDMAVWESY